MVAISVIIIVIVVVVMWRYMRRFVVAAVSLNSMEQALSFDTKNSKYSLIMWVFPNPVTNNVHKFPVVHTMSTK